MIREILSHKLQRMFAKRNDKGNTAIEFALIAPAFFLLFMAIFDMGFMLVIRSTLELAIFQASRFGRTGATVTGQTPEATAAALVTEYTFGLVNPSQLTFNVTPYASFAAMPALGQANTTNTQDFGSASQPVLYTLTYNYQFITPIVGQFFPNGTYTIIASAVVENEPF
jgi:Flp pilus assembly protein TadG